VEYDLLVAPGADPMAIKLDIQGGDSTEIASNGDLDVHAAGKRICFRKPTIYQWKQGVRQSIPGKYVLQNNHEIGFELAAYDVAKTLVIDPTLVYSTYLGGNEFDVVKAIAIDAFGNAYVAGTSTSNNFPTTRGVFETTCNIITGSQQCGESFSPS
jgi:hypothetical protein